MPRNCRSRFHEIWDPPADTPRISSTSRPTTTATPKSVSAALLSLPTRSTSISVPTWVSSLNKVRPRRGPPVHRSTGLSPKRPSSRPSSPWRSHCTTTRMPPTPAPATNGWPGPCSARASDRNGWPHSTSLPFLRAAALAAALFFLGRIREQSSQAPDRANGLSLPHPYPISATWCSPVGLHPPCPNSVKHRVR